MTDRHKVNEHLLMVEYNESTDCNISLDSVTTAREKAGDNLCNKTSNPARPPASQPITNTKKDSLLRIITIESRAHQLAIALGISIRIQLSHTAMLHVEPPRPGPHLLRQVHPPFGPLIRAVDGIDSPARDAVLVDDDTTAGTLALGSEQSLGASVVVGVKACGDTAPDVDDQGGNANKEDECAQVGSEIPVPAPARLLGDFRGCSGLREFDVFWLSAVVAVVVGGGGGSGGCVVLLVEINIWAVDR